MFDNIKTELKEIDFEHMNVNEPMVGNEPSGSTMQNRECCECQ
jgi:hypothetical protein